MYLQDFIPDAVILRNLAKHGPIADPAFSDIRGYGSRTCPWLNSSCFSAKRSHSIPILVPMYAQLMAKKAISINPDQPMN